MTNSQKEKDQFIMENYPLYGPIYCAKELNIPVNKAYQWAVRLGIKRIGKSKHPSLQKINPNQFWKIETKEVAYFLGYFWADGYINYYYDKKKNSNHYRIAFEIVSEDFRNIENVMDSLGKWSKQKRKRKENWKETITAVTNSKDIYNFLKENNYDEKSYLEPTKILEKIPKDLHCYFWRGFFDGDGNAGSGIGSGKRGKIIQFSSGFEYQWEELTRLYKNIGVTSYIYRNISKKNHKSSKINVTDTVSIVNLANYLLKSSIGLDRKTASLQKIIDIYADKVKNKYLIMN